MLWVEESLIDLKASRQKWFEDISSKMTLTRDQEGQKLKLIWKKKYFLLNYNCFFRKMEVELKTFIIIYCNYLDGNFKKSWHFPVIKIIMKIHSFLLLNNSTWISWIASIVDHRKWVQLNMMGTIADKWQLYRNVLFAEVRWLYSFSNKCKQRTDTWVNFIKGCQF